MNYIEARKNMVECQLLPNKLTSPNLIDAFASVPREDFVAQEMKPVCYMDDYVASGSERSLFPPQVLAQLLQGLDIQAEHKVLVAACGTGYSCSIIRKITPHVWGLEDNEELRDISRHMFGGKGADTIHWVKGAAQKGNKKEAPYDRILLDEPADVIPEDIKSQLKDGGKIAAVVKGADGLMEATILTRSGKTFFTETLFETHGISYEPFKEEENFVF
ncbi:MAG: hypothetical protein OSB62_04815 [Alphaproteobacteria bacterium]|nr:hypothetical protein [Alphaproteobacteria bacterium]